MAYLELETIKAKVRKTPVCIIIPPSSFLADEKVFPLLGPLKVAGELERNGNHVEVLDLSGYKNPEDIISDYISSTSINHFGITATTPQLPSTAKIIEAIRKSHPAPKIILGGPHASLTYSSMQEDVKRNQERRGISNFRQLLELADKIVAGDGENAVFCALDPDNPDRVIDASSSSSPLFLKKGELEQYALPARHLIDLDTYHYYIDGHRATSMIVQLGCPFECGFCSGRTSQFLRMARTRSVEHAISEMRMLYEQYGYTGFMLYDDELNVKKQALEKLCTQAIRLQETLGVEFRLRGFVRSDLFTEEQANLMYKAGFRVLLTGVESGSDVILDAMRKKTTADINSRSRDIAGNAGLNFKALMSIGHPGESSETIQESIDWVLTNNPDDVDWTVITPYPGSPYFDNSIYDPFQKGWRYSIELHHTYPGKEAILWSDTVDYLQQADYYKGIPGEYQAHIWTPALSSEELTRHRDYAEFITRTSLKLPLITAVATQQFEHSMGQLPSNILRYSTGVI